MHAEDYLKEVCEIAKLIDPQEIESMAAALSKVEGRVYMVGLGGSLANCIHMAADLRKLCGIDAVAPDNIAELTAWANDEEWRDLFEGHLANFSDDDALFVLSVGGGSLEVSAPIHDAVLIAKGGGNPIFGIVGPDGGITSSMGTNVIRIPSVNDKHITPHTEAFQAVIWHCLVSHPLLQKRATKW